jgi:hypothetical protein
MVFHVCLRFISSCLRFGREECLCFFSLSRCAFDLATCVSVDVHDTKPLLVGANHWSLSRMTLIEVPSSDAGRVVCLCVFVCVCRCSLKARNLNFQFLHLVLFTMMVVAWVVCQRSSARIVWISSRKQKHIIQQEHSSYDSSSQTTCSWCCWQ